MEQFPLIRYLDVEAVKPGSIEFFRLRIVSDGLGNPIWVPVMIAKGKSAGPVLGLTAAIHGNEINGIQVIRKVFRQVSLDKLSGSIIGVPVVNVPGFQNKKRKFNDGTDLNRVMPGKKGGNLSEIYAHRIMERIVQPVNYIIDLHTASFGRINSHYVRADLSDPVIRKMALLQNTDIVLHHKGDDGTLRTAAAKQGIPTVTVELRDPHRFQKTVINAAVDGVFNVLKHMSMYKGNIVPPKRKPVVCKNSYWIYTEYGGLLEVHSELGAQLKKGERIARISNIFGEVLEEYEAPEAGIVIGKSVDPVGQTGSRIIHLGIIGKP